MFLLFNCNVCTCLISVKWMCLSRNTHWLGKDVKYRNLILGEKYVTPKSEHWAIWIMITLWKCSLYIYVYILKWYMLNTLSMQWSTYKTAHPWCDTINLITMERKRNVMSCLSKASHVTQLVHLIVTCTLCKDTQIIH